MMGMPGMQGMPGMDRNTMFYGDMGGPPGPPPPEGMDMGMMPMGGFGFDEAMKGKGKGMPLSEMQLPRGVQPPGYWQPWGIRFSPPPIILPTTTPAVASKPPWEQAKEQGEGGDSWNKEKAQAG